MSSRLFIENIDSEEHLLATAHPVDLSIVEGYSNANRRREVLAWRAIVRRELGSEVVISYDENGAPTLDNPHINIGVSHSRGVVAVMLSESPCAVDIEQADRDFRRVAERYLSHSEYEIARQYDLFAEMWCAKEALYKYHKKGSVDLVEDLAIVDYQTDSNTLVATILGGEPINVAIRREGTLAIALIG
jgi:phosphopantetheinyl transferase